jgi:superfamily II DNA or RNA helicase
MLNGGNLKTILSGGNKLEDENKKLMEEIEKLKQTLKKRDEQIGDLVSETSQKRIRTKKDIDLYTISNLQRFFKTDEYNKLLENPEVFKYEEGITAFDKNLKKNKNFFYDYQKNFIEQWAVSQQECAILYYGVGTGKTLIAINCAEQFLDINPESSVYFLTPASLVFVIILNMFRNGIDPTRKNKQGEYVYNFISYQQLLISKLDFKKDSLLIVDEVHNLRNFYTQEINEKISARKWEKTDTFSLVGTKLGIELLKSENKFLRTIFMTGTLFVNSVYDIEPIISLGYKKTPLYKMNVDELDLINMDLNRMKVYYDGLISFYRRPTNTPNFSKVKYHFTIVEGEKNEKEKDDEEDAFFIVSRNDFNNVKARWIYNFINKNKNKKTLIYAQFVNRMVNILTQLLDRKKIKYGLITGSLSPLEKQQITTLYNEDKIKILIFTLAIKEGISFKESDNFIFSQPYWNYAITEQIIARAIRSDSHKKGNKSTVNVYLLCGADENTLSEVKKYGKIYEEVMNNDIKNIYNDNIFLTDKQIEDKNVFSFKSSNRDLDLYFRMMKKQIEINVFEKRLLKDVNSFEKSNNIENNEFVEEYKSAIINIENKEKRLLTLKEKKDVKIKLYKGFYEKQLKNIGSKYVRFNEDIKYRQNRNPNIEIKASDKKYENKIDFIKKSIKSGKTLNQILNGFNIPKSEITEFQANFTPVNEVKILIEQSGIKNDNREKLYILEPTMGIGNVINELLKNNNKQNYNIDGVEIHSLFFQIAYAQYDEIDTIRLFNMDYFKYEQKYGYDYVIGNPPFNLRTQVDKIVVEKDKLGNIKKKIEKEDINLFDVDFVARAYNQLKNGGILSMIISDRFLRDNTKNKFVIFKLYLEMMKKQNNENVKIIKIDNFKEDKTITESMKTNFSLICITLKKINNFNIYFNTLPGVENEEQLLNLKKQRAKEKRQENKKRVIKKVENKRKL